MITTVTFPLRHQVAEDKIGYRIVSHEYVDQPIAVIVAECDSHGLGDTGAYAGRLGNAGEGAVVVVVKELVRQPRYSMERSSCCRHRPRASTGHSRPLRPGL